MSRKEKVNILLVDDKPANILALENLLLDTDRILYKASNGKEALQIALNKDIDLIILDVQMPEMDGFEVANILKSNIRTKDIPVIFASAERKEHQFLIKGYGEGAIDYLFKPLAPEIVKAKVNVLLKIQLQKKELQEKNNSLQKSALLINNSADIIGIIDIPSFRIEEINIAFTSILGYQEEEIKNTPLTFFLTNKDRLLVQNLIKKKEEQFSFETCIYCKDRSIKWLQWKVVCKNQKWFVNARDITALKRGERIRNYLATVVKQSNDAIYIHDYEGKIISWNDGAEKIYGYSEKDALNMKIWNIIPDYIQHTSEDIMQQIMLGKKVQDMETKRITKHGKIIDVLFSAAIIADSSGIDKSIAITERNITAQKIADEEIKKLNYSLSEKVEQLEAANKELESFSYSVSHDLRAPLRALSGYSQIIEEDYSDLFDEEAKRLLSNIHFNAQKMGMLIDDLLAFSRLGRKEVQKTDIDMAELVTSVINDLSKTNANKSHIQVHSLPHAQGDHTLITQVWVNLISNAIKYSSKKENPTIEIGSLERENHITYFVKDNGAGFNMEFANKLFGVFQRLHSQEEFQGTGVGLAIVQRIINKHGGRIWAEAKENEGATFYFEFN